jgi:hypothetical protein
MLKLQFHGGIYVFQSIAIIRITRDTAAHLGDCLGYHVSGCERVATVSVFLTVGFSPARGSRGRPSIGMEHPATVALSKVSLL